MRLFVLICLITISGTISFAAENGQPSLLSENWISRPSPEAPSTDEENLAVVAALEQRDVTREKLTAKYDGKKGDYETVTVTAIPESESESGMQVVSRYRILNGQICAATPANYRTLMPSEKDYQRGSAERSAYRLAVDANGINTDRPLISGDRMLAVEFDGRCRAKVVEKNFDHEVTAEYHFKMCD